jgi:hypothetical protein
MTFGFMLYEDRDIMQKPLRESLKIKAEGKIWPRGKTPGGQIFLPLKAG